MRTLGKIMLQVSGVVYIIWGAIFSLSFFSMIFAAEIGLAVMLGIISGYLLFVGIMGVKFCENAGKVATFFCVLGIIMTILMGAGIISLFTTTFWHDAGVGQLVALIAFSVFFVFSALLFLGAALNKLAYR